MTKRQFDAKTKRNAGGKLASDERWQYRNARGRECRGCGAYGSTVTRDRLAERSALASSERRSDPRFAVLGIGSPLRAPACARLLGRLPTLPSDQAARARGEHPTFRVLVSSRAH
ncbi:MAG: hypothetical protein HOW73_43235 [Polyangiaceae bacterium]|nr:hypothetical protein [Polyangiaceae bacterium]